MNLAVITSRARRGIDAPAVHIETHLSNGLPCLNMVGLPEATVKESRDRVRSAIQNAAFEFPAGRITINLAPADLPKEGGRFDLPIALGILAASGQIPGEALRGCEFIGELGLGGEIRPVPGALPAALAARDAGHSLILPKGNAREAALVRGARILAVEHLLELSAFLHGHLPLTPEPAPPPAEPLPYPDLADVCGQEQAKRALAIAACGGHNLLLYGPPGTGKTMLASRLPGLLPELEEQEQLAVAAIRSVAARHGEPVWPVVRPFRAPHHTASAAALVGGGSSPRPGEISLAHHGVLFLDELPEFSRRVLEVLREPLESGQIVIARAREQVCYPARFQLIAAMNPCPCGYQGDTSRQCRCTPDQIRRYRDRLSGPLLDRIDLQVAVRRLPRGVLAEAQSGTSSSDLRASVLRARERQRQRSGKLNAHLQGTELIDATGLQRDDRQMLEDAVQRMGLSARAFDRLLKVARSIADLEDSERVERSALLEALQYRSLDRADAP